MLRTFYTALCLVLLFNSFGTAHANNSTPTPGGGKVFLPMVKGPPPPSNPFGFDVRFYSDKQVFDYALEARPTWMRAGDIFWADVEPQRGVYKWEVLKPIEANLRRIRAAGAEPTLIIQRTPTWAQKYPGRLCGPMKQEYIADFARFAKALAARYASGPMAVNYWEVWNEPDVAPDEVADTEGFGCWRDDRLAYNGGSYYGEVVKRVGPALKAGNPNARVLAGALLYLWPDDTPSRIFLEGMLNVGAGTSFDALSFHAYGEWGANDMLVAKALRIREVLSKYGLSGKPLFATEIAAMCRSDGTCPQNFVQSQANYAARIYALAKALKLEGALWYTLAYSNPGFRYSHLIDVTHKGAIPRPAFFAFRNSARLLQGAVYHGSELRELADDQLDKVQMLIFRKPGSTLYVFWVPQTDFPVLYNLRVPPGTTAICTDHLDNNIPSTYYCADRNNDGNIPRAVNELPQYVEILNSR